MAIEQRIYDLSLTATEDLSAKKYFWAKGSGSFGCALAGAADDDIVGIIQNEPESDRAVEVRRVGISKLECGGTFAAWDKITSDANGKGVGAASGERYGAVALEAGVNGRVVSVLMEIGYVEVS